jgi:hypothetical protein
MTTQRIRFLSFVLAAVVAAGTTACDSRPKATPPPKKTLDMTDDKNALDQLKSAGSDLSKPHHIEFYLLVATQANAEAAQEELRAKGFTVSIREGDNNNWICAASRTMVPTIRGLAAARLLFGELADRYRGAYGGWDASIER